MNFANGCLLLYAGVDETGSVTKGNVEAAVRQLAGTTSSGLQHITIVDAFKVQLGLSL